MAEAIFNSLTNGKATAVSAGVNPNGYEGKTVGEVGPQRNRVHESHWLGRI
jgi:hypothetical protein